MNGGFISFQAFAGLDSAPQTINLSAAWLTASGSGAA